MRMIRSSTGAESADIVQTFDLSFLTSNDYPIFLFTVGYSTAYITAVIYMNRGNETNVSYSVISSSANKTIESVEVQNNPKTLRITLNGPIYRTGVLLRLQ